MESNIYYINLALFGAGAALHVASAFIVSKRRANLVWSLATIAMAAGFIGLTTGQVNRWIVQQRVPIGNSHEFLMTLAWFITTGYFIVTLKGLPRAVSAALAIGIFLAVSFAGVFPSRMEMVLLPALQSNWLKIHVSLNIIGEAAFAVAFTGGLMYLLATTRWNHLAPGEKLSAFALFLASVAVGMSVVLLLRAAAVVQTDVFSRSPFLSLMGAGVLLSLALFPLLWWKLAPNTGSNIGGGIFALAVVSILLSGIILGSVVGSQARAQERTERSLSVVEEIIGELAAGADDTIDRDEWQKAYLLREIRISVFRRLRDIHSAQGYSLERDDVTGVDVPGDVTYPLTLGEIREELRGLSDNIALRDEVAGKVGLPIRRDKLEQYRAELISLYTKSERNSLIPPGAGRETVFIALMVLFALPLFLLLWPVASRISHRLPDLQVLDRTTYRAVMVGFPVFTLGAMVFGAIWAHHAWGKWWSNDPKEIGALMVLLVYAIYLHMRLIKGWKGHHAAIAAVTGFAIAMLSFVGNWVLSGLHSYG